MKSINQVTLLGNLTRDPELRYTPTGSAVINFSIATNREWTDKNTQEKKEMVEYHNIVFWNKAAEILSQFLFKGHKVLVQGRMQTRSWEDKEGNKKYTTEIVGDDFVLLTPKKEVDKAIETKKVNEEKVKDFDKKEDTEKLSDEEMKKADVAISGEKKPALPDEIPF